MPEQKKIIRLFGRQTKASLTVYLALSLAVMLSLCLALIEGARQNGVYMEAECVTDIGLNSILAEYHRELLEQYNLFAIDSSYGTDLPQIAKTQQHLTEYINRNLSTDDLFLNRILYRDFFGLSLDQIELTEVSYMTDDGGAIFHRRAAEAVWDDLNLSLFQELQGWMQVVEVNQLDSRDVAAEKQKLDEELQSYDGMRKQISEKKWITIDVTNPTAWLEEKRSYGILDWVVEDTSSLSTNTVHEENLISTRAKYEKLNQGNGTPEELPATEQMLENFFFREYLLRYMGHYGALSEEDALKYQIEYLLIGKENDLENLKGVVNEICALREAANATYIVSDEEKCAAAEMAADALAALMTIPEAGSVLKYIILLGWAYAESLYDMKCLMKGGKVPLMKTSDTWHYDLDSFFSTEEQETDLTAPGLGYADYLRILMTLKSEDILTMRAMNMVEADLRQTPGNEAFRLDGCIDHLEARVCICSAFGYDCEFIRRKGYNTQ